jgi:hypothetical protein
MNRRLFVTSLVILLAVLVTGTASAYWRGSGTGAGSGSAGTTVAVQLTPATPSAALYPGGQTDVALTATNVNFFAVRINSLALDTARGTGGFAVDAGHSACATSTLSYTTQTNGAGWTVPAKVGITNGVLPITLTNALAMSVSAANACQGANLTVYLIVGS